MHLRRNLLDYEQEQEVKLFHSQKFRKENFLPVTDKFALSLERQAAYTPICSLFGFLRDLDSLTG